MIDCHAHLESPEFKADFEELMSNLKKELKAVITSNAHVKDFDRTWEIYTKNKGFVFVAAGFHPEFVDEITAAEMDEYMDNIKSKSEDIVSIGEIGLDYHYARTDEKQNKQKEVFVEWLNFSKELKKPVSLHVRDAFDDVFKILESEDIKKAHFHMFGGYKYSQKIVENNWVASLNLALLHSKAYKKVASNLPLENIMLETDSPWLGFDGKRNDPRSVKLVAQKIAEIKKIDPRVVEEKTDLNAVAFFDLKLRQ